MRTSFKIKTATAKFLVSKSMIKSNTLRQFTLIHRTAFYTLQKVKQLAQTLVFHDWAFERNSNGRK